jgi:hypothetical protein
MAVICLIRPDGPAGNVQNTFCSWAGTHHASSSLSTSHRLLVDYSAFYSSPPSSLPTDVGSSEVVIFYGHGEWDCLVIDDGSGTTSDWVCLSPTPPALGPGDFVNKLLVAVACQAGHTLGPSLKAVGASAFLGFDDLVAVVHTPGLSSSHYEDAFVAGPKEVLNSLASGSGLSAAATGGKNAWFNTFNAAYSYFRDDATGAAHPNASTARVYAHFAANHAVSL